LYPCRFATPTSDERLQHLAQRRSSFALPLFLRTGLVIAGLAVWALRSSGTIAALPQPLRVTSQPPRSTA
jgi:hypothetical protein